MIAKHYRNKVCLTANIMFNVNGSITIYNQLFLFSTLYQYILKDALFPHKKYTFNYISFTLHSCPSQYWVQNKKKMFSSFRHFCIVLALFLTSGSNSSQCTRVSLSSLELFSARNLTEEETSSSIIHHWIYICI